MTGDEQRPDAVASSAVAPYLHEDVEDLYEHAPCGYLSWLPDGTIVKVNETFLRWTGYEREAVVGRVRFTDLLTVGGRLYAETHLGPLLRMQDEVREVALDIRRADGRALPVLLNSVLRRDEHGRPVVVRTTVFDATDRRSYEREILHARRAEQAARERVERLQGLTARLAAAVDEAEVVAALEDGLSADAGVAGVAVVTGGPEAPPAGAEHEPDPDRPDVLAIPLETGGRTTGLVRVTAAGDAFDDAQRELLVACAAQGAQALARVRLQAATVRAARRAALLAEAGRVAGDADVRAGLARLLELLVPDVADVAWVDRVADAPAPVAAPGHASAARLLPASAGEAEDLAELDGASWSCACADLPEGARLRLARALPGRSFDPEDRRFVGELGERAGAALEVARLSARDREVARTLQQSLLAGELPSDPRLPIATSYRPAVEGLQVGGDWFDAFFLTEDVIGVVVGDVVGRGVEAAGSMGQLRSAVRALAGARPGPAELLERLDRFSERVRGAEMATLAYAEVDLTTRRLRYACAGHPPPLLVAPDGEPVLLWAGRSTPLGAYLTPEARAEGELVLEPGSRVVLYTDGLVERRQRGLDEQLVRLCDEVSSLRATPLGSFGRRLADAMLADESSPDDVCLLAFDLAPPSELRRELGAIDEIGPLRDDVRSWLQLHGVGGDDAHAVVLSCSEAVTNAIEHGHRDGGERVQVHARLHDAELDVVVTDEGTWRPGPSDPHRGRGLSIIRAVMQHVDVVREGGTRVRMRRTIGRAEPQP